MKKTFTSHWQIDDYFCDLYKFFLQNKELYQWIETIPSEIVKWKSLLKHASYKGCLKNLDRFDISNITSSTIDASGRFIEINSNNITDAQIKYTNFIISELKPWRKGPYKINGIELDSEWRSDLKWQRISKYLNLENKACLDVGTGNGYHMWRMLDEGAKYVVGIEPYDLFFAQFFTIKTFARYHDYHNRIHMIPLGVESVSTVKAFDYVFSMGVLYHRKDPYEHIQYLKGFLKSNGTLILESIIIDGDKNTVLVPYDRYASMGNVFYIPSIELIKLWLEKAGYSNIRVIDISVTTSEEQRVTDWINDASLKDFLDPNDSSKTIEGYPAPKRVIILANNN